MIVEKLIIYVTCVIVSGVHASRLLHGGASTSDKPNEGEVINAKLSGETHGEPTCDELRAMWRFSKRQSRAAEITNEIPMYKDPFTNNVWQMSRFPYNNRFKGIRNTYRASFGDRPVYGRVITRVPAAGPAADAPRARPFDTVMNLYGTVRRGVNSEYVSRSDENVDNYLSSTGSFQHLKELIRTERARELHRQRLAEELQARIASVKDYSRQPYRQRPKIDKSRYLYYNAHNGHAPQADVLNEFVMLKPSHQTSTNRNAAKTYTDYDASKRKQRKRDNRVTDWRDDFARKQAEYARDDGSWLRDDWYARGFPDLNRNLASYDANWLDYMRHSGPVGSYGVDFDSFHDSYAVNNRFF